MAVCQGGGGGGGQARQGQEGGAGGALRGGAGGAGPPPSGRAEEGGGQGGGGGGGAEWEGGGGHRATGSGLHQLHTRKWGSLLSQLCKLGILLFTSEMTSGGGGEESSHGASAGVRQQGGAGRCFPSPAQVLFDKGQTKSFRQVCHTSYITKFSAGEEEHCHQQYRKHCTIVIGLL